MRLQQGWSPLWGKQHTQADFRDSKLHVNMPQHWSGCQNWNQLILLKETGEKHVSGDQLYCPGNEIGTFLFRRESKAKTKTHGRSPQLNQLNVRWKWITLKEVQPCQYLSLATAASTYLKVSATVFAAELDFDLHGQNRHLNTDLSIPSSLHQDSSPLVIQEQQEKHILRWTN